MSKESKYGLTSLKRDFPTDAACLEFLFDSLHTRQCSCGGTYSLMKTRKQYQCSRCRFQIAPTAGTLFHKSSTPLTLWFHALWIFSNAKSGISAKELERQLEVTYKTAWRMLKLIRECLGTESDKLHGDVEMDMAYFGGRSEFKDRYTNKSVVLAAVERGGSLKAEVVEDGTAVTHSRFLERSIEKEGTRLMTDSANVLHSVARGYERYMVDHSRGEYVRGDVYTNTMESYFAHVKRSIAGTHKVISKKHLQSYLDGFSFHYNNRHNDRERFSVLLGTVLLSGGS